MKYYYIVRDGEIIARDTNKKRALDKVRKLQSLETHFLLKANFELLTQDPTIIPPEVSPYPLCWHIIDGRKITGAVCHRDQVGDLPKVLSIFGKLEPVKYRL